MAKTKEMKEEIPDCSDVLKEERPTTTYNWNQICNIKGITGINRTVVQIKFSDIIKTAEGWETLLKENDLL